MLAAGPEWPRSGKKLIEPRATGNLSTDTVPEMGRRVLSGVQPGMLKKATRMNSESHNNLERDVSPDCRTLIEFIALPTTRHTIAKIAILWPDERHASLSVDQECLFCRNARIIIRKNATTELCFGLLTTAAKLVSCLDSSPPKEILIQRRSTILRSTEMHSWNEPG